MPGTKWYLTVGLLLTLVWTPAVDADELEKLLAKDDICRTIDMRAIAEHYFELPENANIDFVYLTTDEGFSKKDIEASDLDNIFVYKVPLKRLKSCTYKLSPLYDMHLKEVMILPGGKVNAALDAFARDTAGIEGVSLDGFRGRLDSSAAYDDFDPKPHRDAADFVALQVESAMRRRKLDGLDDGLYSSENLIQAAAGYPGGFRFIVIYSGHLDDTVARNVLSDISVAAGVDDASDVALLGEDQLTSFVSFGNKERGTANYYLLRTPVPKPPVGNGAIYQETLYEKSGMHAFDESIGDQYYIVGLVTDAIRQLGVPDAIVKPIGPIQQDSAILLVDGMQNRINPPSAFSGKRAERLRLVIDRANKILKIDQRYEYNLWSGTQRWRDPEDPRFLDATMAENAKNFLGELIAKMKLIAGVDGASKKNGKP